MARRRYRAIPGQHLVANEWGETRHSGQVRIGKWGAQRGLVVDKDEFLGPSVAEMRRPQPRHAPTFGPHTGPEVETYLVRDADGELLDDTIGGVPPGEDPI